MYAQPQPTIIVLKEGTDSSQGKPQLLSNITACQVSSVQVINASVSVRPSFRNVLF